MGKKHAVLGGPDSGIPYLDKAIELAKKYGNNKFLIWSMKVKGATFSNMGKIIEAQQILLEALTIARDLGELKHQADIYFKLGEFYRHQHDVAKAVEYYKKSGEVTLETGETINRCRSNYSIAITYKVSGQDSLENIGIALLEDMLQTCYNENETTRSKALVLTSLGSMYVQQGKFDLALDHIQKGLKIKKMRKDSASMAYSYNELATLFEKEKKYLKAIEYGKLALEFTRFRNDVLVAYDIQRQLAYAYEQVGQYDEAYRHLEEAFELNDSVSAIQKAEVLLEMEAKYETSLKEEQINAQNLEIALQKNQFNQLLIIGLIFISLIGGFSLWYYFRFQNKAIGASKSQELEQMKSRFLANISHEFRTPLSLIVGPLKKIMDPYLYNQQSGGKLPPTIPTPSGDLQLVIRNATRLQQLIGQLLDLSQLEINQNTLNLRPLNLSFFMENMIANFRSQAESRGIQFDFEGPTPNLLGHFDEEKINVILMNLLSNAFKFTRDGGVIKVSLIQQGSQVKIKVKDNGEGIDPKNQGKIFQRFYQVDNSTTRVHEGSGIGLALSKELAEIQKGHISLESELGKGSTFTLVIPYQKATVPKAKDNEDALISRRDLPLESIHTDALFIPTEEPSIQHQLNVPKILIIEDNQDMRQFLIDCLKEDYQILEVPNGKVGFDLAQEQLPDLILSDVMMPGRGNDGLTLCQTVKENVLTSHIPVILLTAKAAQQDILTGLEFQADDYITKPFDPKILRSRVKNLIAQRKKLRLLFAESVQVLPQELVLSSRDNQFIKEVMEIIENNLANENFGVNELGHALNMNRTQLYRKIKALTNETPSVVLKNIRLQRARHLLEQKVGNVSEIAQMVGYRNPDYFSQSFKKEFGETPNSILQK